MDKTPRLELKHASKSFGRVRALGDGSLQLFPGEVHALLGENGAGKSTLVKLLAGVYQPDSGELLVEGVARRFANPAEARDAGIAVIYQEPTLFADLSIAENIYMGRQPRDRFGRIRYDEMHREVDALLSSLGVNLRAQQLVRGLSIADQQVVEIAKALSLDANVLIMDEPTAALSLAEVERLFTIVRPLRERNVAILFITHRLDEVFALTQRMTIMRDGMKIHDALTDDMSIDAIVSRMVGCDLDTFYPKADVAPGDVRLSVRTSRAKACSRTFPSMCARAKSSRSRGSSAPAAAKSRARSSASTRSMAARSGSRAGSWRWDIRRRPCARVSRSCRRTAAHKDSRLN